MIVKNRRFLYLVKYQKQLKNSFYKISREKLMNYLIKTKEEAWKKQNAKKIYIDNMIRKLIN